MAHSNSFLVAKLPLRLAVLTSFLNRPPILPKNEGSFPTTSNFYSLVGWNSNGSSAGLCAG